MRLDVSATSFPHRELLTKDSVCYASISRAGTHLKVHCECVRSSAGGGAGSLTEGCIVGVKG